MTGWQGTPGPWKADTNHGCRRITAKKWGQHKQAKRCEVACTPGLFDDNEDKANAAGIAAVPQLVEALVAVLRAKRIDARGPVIAQVHAALRAAGVTP